jgi:hypothetical protein
VALGALRPPGPAWRRAGGGLAGEQLLLAIISEGAPTKLATAAAAGWRAGRFELWRRPRSGCPLGCGSGYAGLVAIRFRDHADVRQLAEAFFDYALLGRLGQRVGERTWRLAEGYANLATGPRAAAIALAPGRRAALALAHRGALRAGAGRRSARARSVDSSNPARSVGPDRLPQGVASRRPRTHRGRP